VLRKQLTIEKVGFAVGSVSRSVLMQSIRSVFEVVQTAIVQIAAQAQSGALPKETSIL